MGHRETRGIEERRYAHIETLKCNERHLDESEAVRASESPVLKGNIKVRFQFLGACWKTFLVSFSPCNEGGEATEVAGRGGEVREVAGWGGDGGGGEQLGKEGAWGPMRTEGCSIRKVPCVKS